MIISGSILAMATGGLFYPNWTPSTVSGETLEVSPAVLLRAFVIQELLAALPTASGAVWPAYLASLPDGDLIDHDCMCFYDTAGIDDGRLMVGPVIQHYGLQVKVRSSDYQEGWAKIQAISAALQGIQNEVIIYDSDTYIIRNVSHTTPIVPLGNEYGKKRRFEFVVNLIATIQQTA